MDKLNKKGVELSLQTVVVLIIILVVVLVMIFFFADHFLSGFNTIGGTGEDVMNNSFTQ